jgi:ABC-type multidrug transport system fused ATPase/permease subunit
MDDVTSVQTLVTGQTVAILTDTGTALAVSALLLLLSPWLFLVVLCFLPVYVASFRWFGRRIRAGAQEARERLDTVFGHLKAKCDGVLVVKACAREEAEMTEFAAQIDAAHAPRVRVERLNAALATLSLAVSGVGTALVFAVGALLAVHGALTPGQVVAGAALAALLFGPAARLAELSSVFQSAAASVGRLGEILDQESDVPEPQDPLPLGRARGLVEFDRVTFAYRPGHPVLRDVRLRVEPGMKVALVGPTGCGKSTLLNLLMRLYDPTWGEVRLDGKPLRRLALADLRRAVGVVPQEAVIFRTSLADNIRYGAPDADDRRVEEAARAALVHGFAGQLTEGYATLVGEGGHRLSQGQRQRVGALQTAAAVVISGAGTVAVLAYGACLVQAGVLSVGALLAFYALLAQLYNPIVRLTQFHGTAAGTLVAVDRIAEVLDEPETLADHPGALPVLRPRGALAFRGVSFAYRPGGPSVLERVDLQIEPGMKVGVLGESGSGKSTLLALAPWLYDLAEGCGAVAFDGRDVREYRLADLRRAVALVPQQAVLFEGTVRSNLTYARPGAPAAVVRRVLEVADLAGMVEGLPEGLDTPVGERGFRALSRLL